MQHPKNGAALHTRFVSLLDCILFFRRKQKIARRLFTEASTLLANIANICGPLSSKTILKAAFARYFKDMQSEKAAVKLLRAIEGIVSLLMFDSILLFLRLTGLAPQASEFLNNAYRKMA